MCRRGASILLGLHQRRNDFHAVAVRGFPSPGSDIHQSQMFRVGNACSRDRTSHVSPSLRPAPSAVRAVANPNCFQFYRQPEGIDSSESAPRVAIEPTLQARSPTTPVERCEKIEYDMIGCKCSWQDSWANGEFVLGCGGSRADNRRRSRHEDGSGRREVRIGPGRTRALRTC